MDDIEIIELYWRRSQEAIGQTEIKYGGMCRGISYNILASTEDSEECVSDTYMALWQRMPPAGRLYCRHCPQHQSQASAPQAPSKTGRRRGCAGFG